MADRKVQLSVCGEIMNQGDDVIVLADGEETSLVQLRDAMKNGKAAPISLTREAAIVHEGTFMSINAGKVTVDEDVLLGIANSINTVHMSERQEDGKGFPVQLDHSRGAGATVGRGNARAEVKTVNLGGVDMKAVVTQLTFLGQENTAKVIDGRWAFLSTGYIDNGRKSGILETSVVAFPAAGEAQLLSEGTLIESMEPELRIIAAHSDRIVALATERWEFDNIRYDMRRAVEAFTGVIEFIFTESGDMSDEEQLAKANASVSDLLTVITSQAKRLMPDVTLAAFQEIITMTTKNKNENVEPVADDKLVTLEAQLEVEKGKATELAEQNARLEKQVLTTQLSTGLGWLVAAGKISPAVMKAVNIEEHVEKGRDYCEAKLGAWAALDATVELGARGDRTAGDNGEKVELSEKQIDDLRAETRKDAGLAS